MLIINRGMWFQPMGMFARDLAATCRFLRFTLPDKLITLRQHSPGPCQLLGVQGAPSHAASTVKAQGLVAPYTRAGRTCARKSIVESFGIVYMDVNAQTQFRADGHPGVWRQVGREDLTACTIAFHRAVHTWVQLLYNTLGQLKI